MRKNQTHVILYAHAELADWVGPASEVVAEIAECVQITKKLPPQGQAGQHSSATSRWSDLR